MGPPLISGGGRRWPPRSVAPAVGFNGSAADQRRRGARFVLVHKSSVASMGPPLISGGGGLDPVGNEGESGASMGPPLISGGGGCLSGRAATALLASMGPPLISGGGALLIPVGFSGVSRCFNGSAADILVKVRGGCTRELCWTPLGQSRVHHEECQAANRLGYVGLWPRLRATPGVVAVGGRVQNLADPTLPQILAPDLH